MRVNFGVGRELHSFAAKYPVVVRGQEVFCSVPTTEEEYLTREREMLTARLEASKKRRTDLIWNKVQNDLKPVRKPIFDRNQINPIVTDTLSQMIRMEMAKQSSLEVK